MTDVILGLWGDPIFVNKGNIALQTSLTEAILLCISSMDMEELSYTKDVKNGPLIVSLSKGVSVYLDVSDKRSRINGMKVAVQFAAKMGKKVNFDELDAAINIEREVNTHEQLKSEIDLNCVQVVGEPVEGSAIPSSRNVRIMNITAGSQAQSSEGNSTAASRLSSTSSCRSFATNAPDILADSDSDSDFQVYGLVDEFVPPKLLRKVSAADVNIAPDDIAVGGLGTPQQSAAKWKTPYLRVCLEILQTPPSNSGTGNGDVSDKLIGAISSIPEILERARFFNQHGPPDGGELCAPLVKV